MDFVFGYGSLCAAAERDCHATELRGHRRRWGVAMDNREAIPGYKRYADADGSLPALHVAFLDIVPGTGTVNGVCRPVDDAQLAVLDERERNYDRIDVTEQLDAPPPGRAWAYLGSPAGRARLASGRAAGTAVVSADYLGTVLRAFAALGAAQLARFHASSDLDDLPIRRLQRADLTL